MNCALCLMPETLCGSHIIPEFLYKHIYGKERRALIVREDEDYIGILQKGYREPLLCKKCEAHLNKNLEQKFKFTYEAGIWENATPIGHIEGTELRLASGLDYTVTKLFFLSILWRMSQVRGSKGLSQINLGPHGEILRKAIINLDPLEERVYPIRLMRLKFRDGEAQLISAPIMIRDGSLRFIRFCIPHYLVTIDIGALSVMRSKANSLNLRLDGTIGIPLTDCRNLADFQDIVRKIISIDSKGKR